MSRNVPEPPFSYYLFQRERIPSGTWQDSLHDTVPVNLYILRKQKQIIISQ